MKQARSWVVLVAALLGVASSGCVTAVGVADHGGGALASPALSNEMHSVERRPTMDRGARAEMAVDRGHAAADRADRSRRRAHL